MMKRRDAIKSGIAATLGCLVPWKTPVKEAASIPCVVEDAPSLTWINIVDGHWNVTVHNGDGTSITKTYPVDISQSCTYGSCSRL